MKASNLVMKTFIVCLLSLLAVSVVYAETRTVGDTTGRTWIADGYIKAYTRSSYAVYQLYVNLRAWGQYPNPLKEQQTHTAYNTTTTQTLSMFFYNAYFPSQHLSRIYPGGAATTFYTSMSGTESSYYCWSAPNCD
jgi:hypothetical protein